jgi:hypothetical protein
VSIDRKEKCSKYYSVSALLEDNTILRTSKGDKTEAAGEVEGKPGKHLHKGKGKIVFQEWIIN